MIRPSTLARTIVITALCVVGGVAGAAPKVAITPIDGDSDKGALREAVTQALRGNDLVVVPKKDVNEAIDGLEDISAFSEADW